MSRVREVGFYALALGFAACLMGVTMAMRPDQKTAGLPAPFFWRLKMTWQQEFDVAVAGDSRVYRGISPAAIASELGGARVANYGFGSAGLCRDYLESVSGLLDPNATRKTIVLGVTPWSLTDKACADNQYRYHRRKSRTRVSTWDLFEAQMESVWFRPLAYEDLKGFGQRERPEGYYMTYQSDGWVASHRYPLDESRAVLDYQEIFKGNVVSETSVADVEAFTREWRAAGIKVFAFRPPIGKALYELEQERSGFDEKAFIDRFVAAGGVWIDVSRDGPYTSYDGSHLERTAAVSLSRALGRKIRDATLSL